MTDFIVQTTNTPKQSTPALAHDWRCPGCGMDRQELQRKAATGNLNLAEKVCHMNRCGRREAWAKGGRA